VSWSGGPEFPEHRKLPFGIFCFGLFLLVAPGSILGTLVDADKELGNGELKCFRYDPDALKREIALTPLDLTNVCPVHTAHFRHPLLRPFPLFPKLADACSERALNVLGHS